MRKIQKEEDGQKKRNGMMNERDEQEKNANRK